MIAKNYSHFNAKNVRITMGGGDWGKRMIRVGKMIAGKVIGWGVRKKIIGLGGM